MIENDKQQSISDEYRQVNTRGRGHGREAARGNRATTRGVRRNKQQQDALLQIQYTSNDRGPRIPLFTARKGLQVQLPNSTGTGEYLSLLLTDEFLVEQTNLYAAQYASDKVEIFLD